MSNGSFGEKTEQATPHRLQEARKKGQVIKSTDLCSAFSLLIIVLFFLMFQETIFFWLQETVADILGNFLTMEVTDANLRPLILLTGVAYFKIMGLIFVAGLSAGLVINYAQVGFVFSTEKLSPSLGKLNPLEGFKRIFSRRAMFEFLKSVLKICLVAIIVYIFIRSRFEVFLGYMLLPPDVFFTSFVADLINLSLRVGLIFIILAVLDYIYQRHEYFSNLKMTKQEVKEEYKQMEGDPLIRKKLREKQRNMASKRMMHEVPSSTVVVTNPTELAVALKYSGEETPVPVVVAKGAGIVAARIREVAKENKVPLIENRTVARMLYSQVEIGQAIPVELYQSVAEILALVYRINSEHGGVK